MTALASNHRISRDFLGWPVVAFYTGLFIASLPPWPFGWHLALHIAGAALLIGNAVAMAGWLTVAGFSKGDSGKRRAARAVIVGDAWFTVPGVALLLLNGFAMVMERYGGPGAVTTTPFIGIGLVLLTLTGLIWALRLVPAQLDMYRLSIAPGPLDNRAFRRALTRWSIWGVVATALPILAVFVMNTKPTF